MSYRAGLDARTAVAIGAPELAGEPRIVCDDCGNEKRVPVPPPVAFLDRKRSWPRGWLVTFTDSNRTDYCPRCRGSYEQG